MKCSGIIGWGGYDSARYPLAVLLSGARRRGAVEGEWMDRDSLESVELPSPRMNVAALKVSRLTMTTVVELRAELARRGDCEFVGVDEFLTRLTSHVVYERCNEPAANLLGLLNPETGRRFLVGVEEVSCRPVSACAVLAGI